MQEYHILTGDILSQQLHSLDGVKIVLRECLVEGNVSGNTLREIFTTRADFFTNTYGITKEEYKLKSEKEIIKIQEIEKSSVVNLWFEDDLFCQVNFWFAMHFINIHDATLYLVSPFADESWNGFGHMDYDDLLVAYKNRKEITESNRPLLSDLWKTFQKSDWSAMIKLAEQLKDLLPKIEVVVEAHIQRFQTGKELGRPHKTILQILDKMDKPDFKSLFQEFSKVEGIYGFGDSQFRHLLDEMDVSFS